MSNGEDTQVETENKYSTADDMTLIHESLE